MSLRRLACALSLGLAAVASGIAPARAQAPAEWREVPAQNLLVIDTSKGRVLVEMRPDVAPGHVERITALTRQGFYDGLKFHRVIDQFMAQTGDPQGTGAGGSTLPDLAGEFCIRRGAEHPFTETARTRGQPGRAQVESCLPAAGTVVMGFIGPLPVQTQPDDQMMVTRDGRVDASVLFCQGVAGMARAQGEASANSQFFLTRQPAPSLNQGYTAWGRVIAGLDVVRALKAGPEPDGAVVDPDTMTRVRIAADLPAGERPAVRVLQPASARFRALVEAQRTARGAAFSPCDIEIPAEVTGA
ncbi:MAG TPA: peptidylprolyl isomerase [Caulobacteraceae bacterium]|jgi:peptidylprolyl isomerase